MLDNNECLKALHFNFPGLIILHRKELKEAKTGL